MKTCPYTSGYSKFHEMILCIIVTIHFTPEAACDIQGTRVI